MPRNKRNKPYIPKPTSLAGWILAELVDTVGAAIRDATATDKANIEEVVSAALSKVLNSRRFKKRAKSAGATERQGMERQYKKIINTLVDLHAAPPDPEHFPADMFAKWPDMKSQDIDVRMRAADPDTVRTLMRGGAETVIDAADSALAQSAGDAEAPDQQSLAAWIAAGECPAEVLREVAKRLAAVVDVKPDAVRVTGWAFGGLIVWYNGREIHVPAGQLVNLAEVRRRRGQGWNPLALLVRAWNERPLPIKPETRLGILASGLAHIDPADRRAETLFSPAADLMIENNGYGQLITSAVAGRGSRNPTLPPTLWGLGELPTGGGPGEAIATRLWVYAVRRVSRGDWLPGQPPRPLAIPMRDLRKLWPNKNLSVSDLRRKLDGAAKALASPEAAWPWTGGDWRVVTVRNVGRSLDDSLVLDMSIPPGVQAQGPSLPPQLEVYGANNKYAYRGMIAAAFDWWQPGRMRIPNKRGGWRQTRDRDAYAVYGLDELVDMLAPRTSRNNRAHIRERILAALVQLDVDGLILLEPVSRREVRMLHPGLATPPTNESTPQSDESTPPSDEISAELN